MLELNRKTAPNFKTINSVNILKATKQQLSNNIPVYTINSGTQEIIKIEFLFNVGISNQALPLQAVTVNNLLEEGTSKYSANEIANKIDYFGAFLETYITQESSAVVLYTLNKHLKSTLPIIEEIIKDATFPESELNINLKNKYQSFKINNQKVDNVARKKFSEIIFGNKHPYGINVTEEDFKKVKKEHLQDYYNRFYCKENCTIILSGNINDDAYETLNKHFGQNTWNNTNNLILPSLDKVYKQNYEIEIPKPIKLQHTEYMDNTVQSAIRIGKVMPTKTHKDFHSLTVLNTILGGYFGSRLMTNIREDKGYTYGIGSGMIPLKKAGYFFISTEVGVEVCNKAIDEIYIEINRLRNESISEKELILVKNYMIGSFLRSIDGPFALANRFKSIMEYDLDYSYYDDYISTIKNIKASDLLNLANKYLDPNSMTEVVAGKR